jgi:hypothetical protein
MMPLVPTPARLKLLQACDQWHSSQMSTPLTSSHCKLRPNTEGLPVPPCWNSSRTRLIQSTTHPTRRWHQWPTFGMRLGPTQTRCGALSQARTPPWQPSFAQHKYLIPPPPPPPSFPHQCCVLSRPVMVVCVCVFYRPTLKAASVTHEDRPAGEGGISHLNVRCAFFDRNLHSRMPLVLIPARFKRARV